MRGRRECAARALAVPPPRGDRPLGRGVSSEPRVRRLDQVSERAGAGRVLGRLGARATSAQEGDGSAGQPRSQRLGDRVEVEECRDEYLIGRARARSSACVPFVVVVTTTRPATRSRPYSAGEFPASKPGSATFSRSPPSIVASRPSAFARSMADSGVSSASTRDAPLASAVTTTVVQRSTSITTTVRPARAAGSAACQQRNVWSRGD